MRTGVLFGVFLDLWKAYNALDLEVALELLPEYGFGPRMIRLLQAYWYQLTVVAKAGGYFVRPLKRYGGVMQ